MLKNTFNVILYYYYSLLNLVLTFSIISPAKSNPGLENIQAVFSIGEFPKKQYL